MKLIVFGIAGLLASPASALEPRVLEVEDVLALASVSNPEISPEGRWVAYVVTRRDFEENINDSDVWVVRTEDGEPVQLTHHKGADNSPRWAPDGTWLAFVSDRGEKTQVYGIRPDGGEAWPVTEWATDVESFRFSPDGARLGFVAKPEKTEDQEAYEKERGRPHVWSDPYADEWSHLWVAPLADGRAQEVERYSPDNLYVSAFVWAPDSQHLAFAGRPSPELRSFRHTSVYVVDEAGGDARPVTDMPGGESPVAWTEAHGLIVSGTAQLLGTYNRKLWKVSPSGEAPVSLTDGLDENAGYVAASEDTLVVEASVRTGRGLVRIDLTSGVAERADLGSRFQSSFSATRDGSMVAFLAESATEPPNVFVSDVGSPAPKRLTNINTEVDDELVLGEQRVVRWRSRADGEEIEGVLTLPVGYGEGERVPLLLVIHGGPSGVSSDRFSTRRSAYPIQVFAGKGYAVLQPNYRGSTGYGERFRGLNRGDISGKDWIDIDSGVDAMIERGIADAERLGIMGWSFGGHHTYWGITQTDRYQAASAGAGANDLISMYSQTDIPEFYHTYLGPKPWEDFELYQERSAYRNVGEVVTPLLIQVGENDERVPAEQSIQFYEAVRALGKVETELVIYPGQPHGVRDPRLLRDLMLRNVEWFTRLIPVTSAGATSDSGS
jgi:dipeptidyl aminopeptidase/acylaminoacyl peptidase